MCCRESGMASYALRFLAREPEGTLEGLERGEEKQKCHHKPHHAGPLPCSAVVASLAPLSKTQDSRKVRRGIIGIIGNTGSLLSYALAASRAASVVSIHRSHFALLGSRHKPCFPARSHARSVAEAVVAPTSHLPAREPCDWRRAGEKAGWVNPAREQHSAEPWKRWNSSGRSCLRVCKSAAESETLWLVRGRYARLRHNVSAGRRSVTVADGGWERMNRGRNLVLSESNSWKMEILATVRAPEDAHCARFVCWESSIMW